MKKLRFFLTIIISALFLFFLTSCAKSTVNEQAKEHIAIIDLEKVIKEHFRYAAWQLAVENELTTQKLKEDHIKMAKEQAAFIDKMQQLQAVGRESFYQADYAIRMSEVHLAERERLKDIERKEKQRIDEGVRARTVAIEEEYKLPLFNLKTKIETLRPLPRTRVEAEEEKKRLIAQLSSLQAEKNDKIMALYKERDLLLMVAMKAHAEDSSLRIRGLSKSLYEEMVSNSKNKVEEQRIVLAGIPAAYDKTMASLEKQLLEQKMTKDKIYNTIYDDITSQITKIAMQRKITVVLVNVKVNIQAEDITAEVIAALPAK